MMGAEALSWLPACPGFKAEAARLRAEAEPEALFAGLKALANHRLDFIETGRLDRLVAERADALPADAPRLRLALLGSATLDHLAPAIRVGALRRGLLAEILVAPYGQWRQQVLDPSSELRAFAPDAVLLAPDQADMVPGLPLGASAEEVADAVEAAVGELAALWRTLRDQARAAVIQQTPWQAAPSLYGHFERLVPAAPAAQAARLDRRIAEAAAEEGTILLDLRGAAADIGARHIADRALWYHAKQAVSPAAAPWFGDQVGRILAALRGLSKKVVVLDLDNTLWGGTIGDDGLDGIVLGQGNGTGEAFAAFQTYLAKLFERGIVLAVSSKNDRATAEAAFTDHPEMILRLDHFAAFEVDWNDKPSALGRIARQLELGLDSFVFVDDNPAERDLMRRTLPQVAVPELPEAPELYADCLADAGYFEAVSFTAEDMARGGQYAANRKRREAETAAPDMESFLRDLEMTLTVGPFSAPDVPRITQLINKTNQFNLTTRRYTESEVREMMENGEVLTFAARLRDRFGDNGLTSVVICRLSPRGNATVAEIDSWLMSCRILGRRIENAMLSVVAGASSGAGAHELVGHYIPTRKNGMVKELYPKLGFALCGEDSGSGRTTWALDLKEAFIPPQDHLNLVHAR